MTLTGPARLLVVLSAVGAWLSPAPASAAFWIVLDRTSGPSGTVVHGRTLGSGSVTLARNESLPIFLVEQGLASQIDDPADEGLVRVGELVVDPNGDGTTTFTIPDVAPGQYDVLVHCEPCAPSSAGATMLFGADLEVSLTPPATHTLDAGASEAWPWPAIAGMVAMLLVFPLLYRRLLSRA